MQIEKVKVLRTGKPRLDSSVVSWVSGIGFTLFIALLGYWLAKIPGFHHVGQLASAIMIAFVYRQLFGYPDKIRSGIAFSSKKLLRFAIILFGLKLNIMTVFHDGPEILLRDVGVIIFALTLTIWLAKFSKADKDISFLLAVGTGVCGAAAIAAIAPIVKSKDEDVAIGVGIIALIGTIFAILYTIIQPILPLTEEQYGIWTGSSLHEIAQVALAAAPSGEDALALALLAKLGRVFLLIPLCFGLMIFMNKRHQDVGTRMEFPWFLIGFILMSLFGTYVIGNHIVPVSTGAMNTISTITVWCLTSAMVGLGLNVSLYDLRTKAGRPLMVIVIVSICLSVLSFLSV